jgi:hypothetical protein
MAFSAGQMAGLTGQRKKRLDISCHELLIFLPRLEITLVSLPARMTRSHFREIAAGSIERQGSLHS